METKNIIYELRIKKACRKMNLLKKYMLPDKQCLVGKTVKQRLIPKH